jgi:SAM-dependent MidA family methyltransferase
MSHTLNYTLKDRILEKIAKNDGRISFQDFMQSALYDPKAGFYTGNAIPLGKEGHFTTAPEISPLFGECIAQQILPFFKSGTLDCILEFGPGRGKLALSVLRYLEAHNALPETYYFLDLSSTLKAEQQKCIQTQAPHLFERCQWLDKLPDTQLNACVLANEVLDAMPVTRFVIQEGELKEGYVGYSDDALIEIPRPPPKSVTSPRFTVTRIA